MISLEGKLQENERWEDVIEKSTDLVSYKAKCFRPKVCSFDLFVSKIVMWVYFLVFGRLIVQS